MNDFPDFANVSPNRDTAVTVGVFDGVHRGHLGLLSQLRGVAGERGLDTTVVTFRNHPITVLRPEIRIIYLMPVQRRVELLRGSGVVHVAPVTFSQELSELTAREFVTALRDKLRMRHLVAGPDFALGKGRLGTIDVLRELGAELGFDVTQVEPSLLGDVRVSSTKVRRLLAEGSISEAADLLGRPFRLTGAVVRGDQRGRGLGFPTANLETARELAVPGDGIYSTLAHWEGKVFASATSIGVRPTFDVTGRTVETFIMDFDATIYGAELSIDFIERIRPELQFDSVEALVEQMNRDVAQARETLAGQVRAARVPR